MKPIREQYLEWPEQLYSSYKEGLEQLDSPILSGGGRLVVGCGMGGSGFSLDSVSPILESSGYPVVVVKREEAPAYLSSGHVVVAVSYSGETRETVECFSTAIEKTGAGGVVAGANSTLAKTARSRGVPVVEVEKRGYPRSSLAQLVGALTALLFGEGVEDLVKSASSLIDVRRASKRATEIASLIYNEGDPLVPLIVSCGRLGFVAERWATEFSENSKHVALYEVYPEAGHNFIARWYYSRGPYQLVYLDFHGDEGVCAVAKKYILSKYPSIGEPLVLDYAGESRVNQLAGILEAALTAGLASVELALKLGRNPELIEAIDEYKRMSRGEG